MLRPKSGARHNGTLYEYAESSGKSRNSCYKCIHCDDGFCGLRKAQISEIAPNFYRYCEFYKTEDEDNDVDEIVESDKAFDIDSYRKRKAAGKELYEVEISSLTKKSVAQNEKVKNVVRKTITLTKKLDDTKITVKIVNRLSSAIPNKSIIEVTTSSTLGKLMSKVSIGSKVELNGYRCVVTSIDAPKKR